MSLLPKPDSSGIIRFDDGIVINLPLARIVCQDAFDAYLKKTGIHSIIKHRFDAPQSRFIPKGVTRGSPRHVLWLFFTALTDRREVSENVYREAAKLHETHPWICGPGKEGSQKDIENYLERLVAPVPPGEITINPRQFLLFGDEDPDRLPPSIKMVVDALLDTDTDEIIEEITVVETFPEEITNIAAILAQKKVGSPGQSARYWPRVAETLYREFGGDPLEIFRRYPTIDAFLNFKKRWTQEHGGDPFPGIGPKIASLMTMFYDELGLMTMPEDAMPVDVHLQRFALETQIIGYEGTGRLTNEILERRARALYCHICNEHQWSHVDFSHAIWFLSKRLCSSCHRKRLSQTLCPVFDRCHGSIASNSYFRRGIWIIIHRQKNGGFLHK